MWLGRGLWREEEEVWLDFVDPIVVCSFISCKLSSLLGMRYQVVSV